MFSSILHKKSDFFKLFWRSITSLIILASGIEYVTTDKSENICSTPGCEDAANVLRTNMDEKEEPCNDFYKFACGGFLKSTAIPDSEYSIYHIDILKKKILTQIKEALEEEVDPYEPRIFELARNYYKSCLDESTRQKNLEYVQNIIKNLGGWPILEGSKWKEENFDLFEFDRKLRNIGYRPNSIFRIFVSTNISNPSQSSLYIGPPEPLVKPERLSGTFMHPTVQAYYKYMTDVAVLLGATRETAERNLEKVIEFEKSLVTGIRRQITIHNINLYSIEELYKNWKNDFPWLKYINDMTKPIAEFKNHSSVYVLSPSYPQKVVNTLKRTPKETVANYMIWKVIAESIMYLPNEFRDLVFEFKKISSELEAPRQKPLRWRECINLMTDVKSGLGVAVSSIYIRKYFNDTTRKEVEQLTSSVTDAFKEAINAQTRMSAPVKRAALEKIEHMRKIIAYPDELLNDTKIDEYSRSLTMSQNDHFQNFLNLQRFHYEFELSNLVQPTELNIWESFTDSTTINAYYIPLANNLVLLAAILQRPLFNPEWPSYAKFGSMGFIIGHEIMHSLEVNISLYRDVDVPYLIVVILKWQCFRNQYNQYEDEETGTKLNGSITMNENVADAGGLKMAYSAYRNWVEKHGEDPRPAQLQKYTADQLFFASTINFLCSKSTKARRIDDLKINAHSPNNIRTRGMLSNSQEFAEAYSCPVGSTMNPRKKCNIWK